MAPLRISSTFELPAEAVTETFAILAKRGVGKTYTGSVLAEEMLSIGAQIAVLDPLDAWWGLRSSADGKGAGLPIYVFGGEHADLPLEAASGSLLADVVVDHGASVILSLRHLTKQKQRTFVTDFAERLYHRKGEPEHRTPLHVFFDEADAFVPQRVMSDTARMVGAVDDIIRRGRNAGLGGTLISQRAAVVNKDVLSQVEVLVALRTIDSRDRKALEAWIEAHDVHDQARTFMDSLAALEVGEAWVWSPGWLDIFERVRIRQRRTFDSSSTPKAGQRAVVPTKRAEVDLEQLGEQIRATAETAKANDPATLRQRIRELEQLASGAARDLAETKPVQVVEKIVEVPVLNGQVDKLLAALTLMSDVGDRLTTIGRDVVEAAQSIDAAVTQFRLAPRPAQQPARAGAPRPAGRTGAPDAVAPVARAVGTLDAPKELGEAPRLKAGARRMLTALAQLHPTPLTRTQMATLADVSPRSGTFSDYMSAIRTAGMIVEEGGTLRLSDVGQAFMAAELGRGAPSADELLELWGRKLKAGARRMLQVLRDAYPDALTRAELGERAEISTGSGTFSDYMSSLRTNGLLDESTPGVLRAGEALFLGEHR